jgi:hypothetical protein
LKINISFSHRRSHQRSSGDQNADYRGQRNVPHGHDLIYAVDERLSLSQPQLGTR